METPPPQGSGLKDAAGKLIFTSSALPVDMLKITYSGAILEVCMRKLVFYPEIVGFIEEEKDRFPTVKVQYVFNSPPKLIMLDEEGQHKETVRIDNWKREHMLQFLQERVKPKSAY